MISQLIHFLAKFSWSSILIRFLLQFAFVFRILFEWILLFLYQVSYARENLFAYFNFALGDTKIIIGKYWIEINIFFAIRKQKLA